MKKELLKSLGLLLSIVLLGISCSKEAPTEPDTLSPSENDNISKLEFPSQDSLLLSGANNGSESSPTIAFLSSGKKADVEFTLSTEFGKIKSPEILLFKITDTSSTFRKDLVASAWTVSLDNNKITISTTNKEELSQLSATSKLEVVIKVTSSSHKDGTITLYATLTGTYNEITQEQILTQIKKLGNNFTLSSTTGVKSINFDFSKITKFDDVGFIDKYPYNITLSATSENKPDSSDYKFSCTTALAKVKEELTAKLTESTEIAAVGSNPEVEQITIRDTKKYEVKVYLKPNYGYVFPNDFDGVKLKLDAFDVGAHFIADNIES